MNSRDICRFVNSKDIKRYLMDINYRFTATEAAWLVNNCRSITLKEKYDAWEQIIKTMPDEAVDSPHFDIPYESLHKVLGEYMDMKKRIGNLFYESTPKVLYQCAVIYSDYKDSYDDSMMHSSFENCFRQLKLDLSDKDDDILYGCIRQSEIDGTYQITAYYNLDAEITDIMVPTSYGFIDTSLADFFDNLWFHFPVPFKAGDILYNPSLHYNGLCTGPIVMTGITPLQYEEDGIKHSDSSDMDIWGYFQDAESGILYSEVTWNYMDYEYFPLEKLTGKMRILKALSNYIKGEIPLDLFIRAYHIIILEETKKDIAPNNWFTDEWLELAGLLTQ